MFEQRRYAKIYENWFTTFSHKNTDLVCEGVITITLIPLLICVGVQSSFHICPKFLLICNEGATFLVKMDVISILSAYA